jgi:hypothetical protein
MCKKYSAKSIQNGYSYFLSFLVRLYLIKQVLSGKNISYVLNKTLVTHVKPISYKVSDLYFNNYNLQKIE